MAPLDKAPVDNATDSYSCQSIGEDTRDVLTKVLGYTPARIDELRRTGFVAEP